MGLSVQRQKDFIWMIALLGKDYSHKSSKDHVRVRLSRSTSSNKLTKFDCSDQISSVRSSFDKATVVCSLQRVKENNYSNFHLVCLCGMSHTPRQPFLAWTFFGYEYFWNVLIGF